MRCALCGSDPTHEFIRDGMPRRWVKVCRPCAERMKRSGATVRVLEVDDEVGAAERRRWNFAK